MITVFIILLAFCSPLLGLFAWLACYKAWQEIKSIHRLCADGMRRPKGKIVIMRIKAGEEV